MTSPQPGRNASGQRHLYTRCACGEDMAYFHGYEPDREFCCGPCYVAKHEKLGVQCVDGGRCHHGCGETEGQPATCFRRDCCSPFTGYQGVW